MREYEKDTQLFHQMRTGRWQLCDCTALWNWTWSNSSLSSSLLPSCSKSPTSSQVPDSELLETPLKSAAIVSALGMWVPVKDCNFQLCYDQRHWKAVGIFRYDWSLAAKKMLLREFFISRFLFHFSNENYYHDLLMPQCVGWWHRQASAPCQVGNDQKLISGEMIGLQYAASWAGPFAWLRWATGPTARLSGQLLPIRSEPYWLHEKPNIQMISLDDHLTFDNVELFLFRDINTFYLRDVAKKNRKMWEFFPSRGPPPVWECHVFERRQIMVYLHFRTKLFHVWLHL